jgi:hypothetical protein
LEKLRQAILSKELVLKFKMKDQDFTRNRKQTFGATLLFMFNLLRKSLTVEIDGFVRYLNLRFSSDPTQSFTSSAFIQNRKKISPAVFSHLSEIIVENFYVADNDSQTLLNGFRVLAVDGSRITLPFTEKLKKSYGATKNQFGETIVQARASVLYDVLNGIALDASLDNLSEGERDLALNHAHQWKTNDLIIYDRGYPSFDFVYEHVKLKVDCLIRVKLTHNNAVVAFVKGGKKSIITEIRPQKNQSFKDKEYGRHSTLQVRFLRVDLPGGEVEVLMTTLLDSQKYPTKMFKELYFLRWGIETFYDELKNKLKVEHFTGYSEVSIQQDFFCAIFISNLQSVMVNDLKDDLYIQNQGKKYDYKVNTNLSYGFLKNRVIDLLYQNAPLENIFHELETLFLKNTIPIRNNRTNLRDMDKYKNKVKPIVTKNQRDAI